MLKRVLAGVLWFLTGWMIGSILVMSVALPEWTPAAIGVVIAALVVLDPFGWLWEPARAATEARRLRGADGIDVLRPPAGPGPSPREAAHR